MPSLGCAFSFRKKKKVENKIFWFDYIEKRNILAKELCQPFSEIDKLGLHEYFSVLMALLERKRVENANS